MATPGLPLVVVRRDAWWYLTGRYGAVRVGRCYCTDGAPRVANDPKRVWNAHGILLPARGDAGHPGPTLACHRGCSLRTV